MIAGAVKAGGAIHLLATQDGNLGYLELMLTF